MNAAFEQWVHTEWTKENLESPMSAYAVYKFLQKNPHLLREDGEKEIVLEHEPPSFYGAQDIMNPRPTDEQQMEQEAENQFYKYCTEVDGQYRIHKVLTKDEAITALTEFGKMWKERGREEKAIEWSDKEIFHLQQQLAEKDKDVETWKQKYIKMSNAVSGEYRDMVLKYESELTAAKAEIAEKDDQISRANQFNEVLNKELTAAKAEIAIMEDQLADYKSALSREEQKSADLELALRNL